MSEEATAVIDTPQEGQAQDIQPESVQEVGQVEGTHDQGQVDQVIDQEGWQTDKRFKEHWGEDPNKMYDTLRHLEKRQSEFDTAQSQVKELQEYQNTVKGLLDHPELGPALTQVIEDFENNQLKAKYGEMSPEQLEMVKAQDQRLSELEEKYQSHEQEQKFNAIKEEAETQLSNVNALAKEYGIELDEGQFLTYCQENNVPVTMMQAAFLEHALPILKDKFQIKGEENARKNIAAGQKANLTSGKDKQPNEQYETMGQALDRVLGVS
jgi:hypothetical protein